MKLTIRKAETTDIPALYDLARAMAKSIEERYFETCFDYVEAGERDFYVASDAKGNIPGYVMLVWQPRYQPFRRMNIPEVQDLSVAPDLRRQGIGRELVAFCEDYVRNQGFEMIGLAVGLHASFAPAQHLYLKRGYLPDGNGAIYDCQPMGYAEMKPLDDNFVFKMIKDLSQAK